MNLIKPLITALLLALPALAQGEVRSVPWAVGGVEQPALLRVSELKGLLEGKGVKFAEVPILGRNLLEVRFPQTANGLYLRLVDQNNTRFAVFDDLFINLAQVDLGVNVPVKVEGWGNPTVTVGQTSFKLGTKAAPVNPYLGYMYIARKTLIDRSDAPPYLAKLLHEDPKARRCAHDLRVSDPAGTVYAVMSRAWAEANQKAPYDKIPAFARPAAFHVAPVANGRVRLLLPEPAAEYARSVADWEKAKDPEALLLVKLSGKVTTEGAEYQVVVPPQGRTQAAGCK